MCCAFASGEIVTVTDRAGKWRLPQVGGTARSGAAAWPAIVEVDRSSAPITLAVAIPKGDRLDWMVQKVTELGLDRLVLVHAGRSTTRWDDDRAATQLDRLRRISVEACRQSRRVWGLEIDGPLPAADVLPDRRRRRAGRSAPRRPTTADRHRTGGRVVDDELRGAAIGCRSAPNILRVETAAVAATALPRDASATDGVLIAYRAVTSRSAVMADSGSAL